MQYSYHKSTNTPFFNTENNTKPIQNSRIMGIGFSIKTKCKNIKSFQQTLDNVFQPFGYDINHQSDVSVIGWHSDFLGSFHLCYKKEKGILKNSYSVSGY